MNKTRNIFVFTEFFSSKQNSTGYFWEKLINKLALSGWNVNLISPDYGDVDHHNLEKKVCIDRFKIAGSSKKNKFHKLINQLIVIYEFAKRIFSRVKKGDVLFTGTNPALILIFMPLFKRIKKNKWILLVHDVYPDNLIAAGFIRRNSFIYKIIYKYYLWVYDSADKIFVIGRDMLENIEEKVGSKEKITYVPNWVGVDDIKTMNKNDTFIIKELGWENKSVFQFFGNFGKLQGVDNILNAIDLIDRDDICFLFIGDGSEKCLIEEYIKKRGSDNVFYYGGLHPDMRSEGLAACDFSIVSLSGGMLGLGVPSKAYFTMAADRKIIGIMDEKSEIALTLIENNIGVVVPPGQANILSLKFIELVDSVSLFNFSSPRDVFIKLFNEDDLLNKISLEIECNL